MSKSTWATSKWCLRDKVKVEKQVTCLFKAEVEVEVEQEFQIEWATLLFVHSIIKVEIIEISSGRMCVSVWYAVACCGWLSL